jgi:hypothetical protein
MRMLPCLLVFACGITTPIAAQPYVPGQTYLSANGHIEYRCGELPLIVAAPHGGLLAPADMPDRTCNDAVWVNDANTQELARSIDSVFQVTHGCRPHLIINHLHRRKMDGNRNLADAACGDPQAIAAWTAFHGYLTAAREQVTATHGRGLFVDLHGHGHQVQRLELGYLLYEDELAWSDAALNSTQAINWSSLRHLANNNEQGLDHADLLRGPQALGTRLAERGYPSVPSQQDPFPQPGQPYFSGGYNTVEHSSYLGGTIDGVQVECNFAGVRDTGTNRTRFADSLRVALEEYLTAHFFGHPDWLMCSPTSSAERPIGDDLLITPTLVVDLLHLTLPPDAQRLALVDAQGRTLREWSSPAGRSTLDLSGMPPGTYTAVLQRAEGAMQRRRFVKQ